MVQISFFSEKLNREVNNLFDYLNSREISFYHSISSENDFLLITFSHKKFIYVVEVYPDDGFVLLIDTNEKGIMAWDKIIDDYMEKLKEILDYE